MLYRGLVGTDGKEPVQWKNGRPHFLKGRCGGFAAFGVLLAVLLSGCAPEEEPEDLIVVDQEEAKNAYVLALAERGDVTLTQEIRCTYEQLVEQEVSFSVSGKRISEVYVKQDDEVQKGQVLARLGDDGISDRIDQLEYQISRNETLLEHSKLNEDYEISALWLQYLYRSGQSEQDAKARDASVQAIQQRYRYQREDYEDAIALDTLELEKLQNEAAISLVYAEINGTVKWVETNLEGSTSVRDETIIRIVDGSECLFAVYDMSKAPLFQEGVPVNMEITMGGTRGNYQLLPYQMEDWETEGRLMFVFADEYGLTVEMGTSGYINVVMDESKDVVYVPHRAVHKADEKSFVYCLSEDGMREIRWVETGLYGDNGVEIISGLSEGERVILR